MTKKSQDDKNGEINHKKILLCVCVLEYLYVFTNLANKNIGRASIKYELKCDIH